MHKILSACRRVRGAFARALNAVFAPVKRAVSRTFHTVFHTRPGLKRAVLVLVLYALVAVPSVILAPCAATAVSGIWAFTLLSLFLGMGAERAAVEWSPTFALPPISAFAFWRWHALEKKRFQCVLMSLGAGLLLTAVAGQFT